MSTFLAVAGLAALVVFTIGAVQAASQNRDRYDPPHPDLDERVREFRRERDEAIQGDTYIGPR